MLRTVREIMRAKDTAEISSAAKAHLARFNSVRAPTTAVTRGLDPRVHPFRIELFAKKMGCRVKPGNDAEVA
jgi:hypothetical protein